MPLPLKDFPRSGEDVAQRQKGDKVSPKVTERAHPLPCGELPPQRLRGLEMAEHKKALSEAASFFVWSPSSLGLKGASSPFLVGPARRNRWHFSGSLLVPKENKLRPVKLFRIIQKLLFISCFSASTVRGESTRGCCGRPSGRRTARRSPC